MNFFKIFQQNHHDSPALILNLMKTKTACHVLRRAGSERLRLDLVLASTNLGGNLQVGTYSNQQAQHLNPQVIYSYPQAKVTTRIHKLLELELNKRIRSTIIILRINKIKIINLSLT